MTRHIRLRELLVGVEGLALLRQMFVGDDEMASARLAEVRRIVGEAEEGTFGLGRDVPELDVRSGYAAWAETYDRPGNPLVAAEQPVVWELLGESAPGRASTRRAAPAVMRGISSSSATRSSASTSRPRCSSARARRRPRRASRWAT